MMTLRTFFKNLSNSFSTRENILIRRDLDKSFFVCFLFLLFALFLLVPHAQSPDERAHLYRAYTFAHGDIFLEPVANGVGGDVDSGLIEYLNKYDYLPFKYYNKVSSITLNEIRTINFSGINQKVSFPTHALYFPISYLPHALGFLFGEHLHLSVWGTLNLIKIICSISIFAILYAAIKIYPIPLASMILMLMPMSIFQCVSATTDGIHFALTILILSLFCRLREFGYQRNLFLSMLVCIFIVGTHRINLSLLAALPLILFCIDQRKSYLLGGIGVFLLICVWILFAMKFVTQPQQPTGLLPVMIYYISHPLEVFKLFYNTFSDKELLEFYRDSFVGQLGWLDYRVSYKFIIGTYVVLFLCVVLELANTYDRTRILLLFLSCLILLSTFFILLVQWTKFPGAQFIAGVQGRYFIPIAMIFFCACTRCDTFSHSLRSKLSEIILIVYALGSLICTTYATVIRYYVN